DGYTPQLFAGSAPATFTATAAHRRKAHAMSENRAPATELTSQYSAQVAGDLDRNTKEQERIAAEIEALQEQLSALQHDHNVLVSMQQALGVASPARPDTSASQSAPERTSATPKPAKAK